MPDTDNRRPRLDHLPLLFGAAYYHEYHPHRRLSEDIALMREAGFTCVRVGESTWSTWEPREGDVQTAWMREILDALHEASISAILGTPTYAIPPWLCKKHPEIMARSSGGQPVGYGWRQNVDYSHPTFRTYAGKVIEVIVRELGQHPAVVGYQADNEPGMLLFHGERVHAAFVEYLQQRYDLEELNEHWGLTYWSRRLQHWSELWPADNDSTPGYRLEWRRFQARLTSMFLEWQKEIIVSLARPDQFVTTCLAGEHGYPGVNRFALARSLDILAENVYHPTQDSLAIGAPAGRQAAPVWLQQYAGPWQIFLKADFGRAGSRSGFLVGEANALSIGNAWETYPPYEGQLRLVAWSLILRGARGVNYWHFHTMNYGWETNWHGILDHEYNPGRVYRELKRLGGELATAGGSLEGIVPDADVAFLYSYDSRYALEFQTCLTLATGAPDPESYQTIFNRMYEGFFAARAQTAIVDVEDSLAGYKLLVVPALYIASDALLAKLISFVEAGGHLLFTFRSAVADELGRMRWHAPDAFWRMVGARVTEFSMLRGDVELERSQSFSTGPDARATHYADGLVAGGAEVLARYRHPHFEQFAALTSHVFGKGRVTWCGTLPNAALCVELARWTCARAQVARPGEGLPVQLRQTTATNAHGHRLTLLSNWSAVPVQVETEHGHVALGAWDAKLLGAPSDA